MATTSIMASMADRLAAGRWRVVSFLPPGADPHTYEPTPGDARRVVHARLLIRNGLTLEGWLDELVANSGTRATIITATEGIAPIESPSHPGAADPHAWLDPLLGIQYARNISAAFRLHDPQGQAYYAAALASYEAELHQIHAMADSLFGGFSPRQRVLITSHDAFQYFARRYGFQVAAAVGTSTGAEARVQDLNQVLAMAESTGVACVFTESTLSPKLLQQIAHDVGIRIGGGLFTDSVGEAGSGAETYTDMLRKNIRTIYHGLSATGETQPALLQAGPVLLAALGVYLLGAGWLVWQLRLARPFAPPAEMVLQANHLTVKYGTQVALKDVSATFLPGRMYGLLGPNGSGKSTLLRTLLGIVPATHGQATLNGRPTAQQHGWAAYVAQREEIDWAFPATVADVVAQGVYAHQRPMLPLGKAQRGLVQQALERVGMAHLANRPIGQLSGGQQRRAFLARALAQGARVLLLDEPFAGVDAATEAQLVALLRGLAAQGCMVLVVHHNLAKVPDYFDDVVLLNGRLVAAGPVAQAFNDAALASAFGLPNAQGQEVVEASLFPKNV